MHISTGIFGQAEIEFPSQVYCAGAGPLLQGKGQRDGGKFANMSPGESGNSRSRLLQTVTKEMLVTIPGLRRHSKALADRNLVFNNLGL